MCIQIGGIPIILSARDRGFIAALEGRYANFLRVPADGYNIRLDVTLIPPAGIPDDDEDGGELEVRFEAGRWLMRRGDFQAEWNPTTGRGTIRQPAQPYAIDSVIRIILSLVLARDGGFLLHAASAMRGGRALLLSGVSGAGKTTIARMAPAGAILLSDEISCVRRTGTGYHAFGTPFAGELGISGARIVAPVAALYFLRQGPRNAIGSIEPARAAATLLRNILFFADDPALAGGVFATACDFAARVAVAELTFRPDPDVWELLR
jgi:hypothetical protein